MAYRTSKPLHPTEFGKPKRTKVVTRGSRTTDAGDKVERKRKVVTRRDGSTKRKVTSKTYKTTGANIGRSNDEQNRIRGERPVRKQKTKSISKGGNTLRNTTKIKDRGASHRKDRDDISASTKKKSRLTPRGRTDKNKGGYDYDETVGLGKRGKVVKRKMIGRQVGVKGGEGDMMKTVKKSSRITKQKRYQ